MIELGAVDRGRQGRLSPAEASTDARHASPQLLKYGSAFLASAQPGPDQAAALGGEISELDTAFAIHGDSARILWVFRLEAQFDPITGGAKLSLESSAALVEVWIGQADDGEAEFAATTSCRILEHK
jgi:hypothetical protein